MKINIKNMKTTNKKAGLRSNPTKTVNFQLSTVNSLSSRRAEGYIDVAIAVLVISFLLALVLNVFSLVAKGQDMEYFARELCDVATYSGRIGDEVENRYAELCQETGLTPQYSFTSTYFSETEKAVQLGDSILCEVRMDTSILGFGGDIFPITLTGSHSGLSKYYWK